MQKKLLSSKLKQYRKQKGMTQEELAELLEVNNKSVSKWELDEGYPNKKNMIKISETLDISLETLINQEQTQDNRLKKSIKYAFVSYFIIIAVTLLIRGIKEKDLYPDILNREISEILKIVITAIGKNIYIAIVPALVIGLVYYFHIIPQQHSD